MESITHGIRYFEISFDDEIREQISDIQFPKCWDIK